MSVGGVRVCSLLPRAGWRGGEAPGKVPQGAGTHARKRVTVKFYVSYKVMDGLLVRGRSGGVRERL